MVERALFRRENVNDHAAEVEKNPTAVSVPLDAHRSYSRLFRRIYDRFGERADVDARAPGDDCKGIGEDGAAAHVDSGKLLSLLVECGNAHDLDQFMQYR